MIFATAQSMMWFSSTTRSVIANLLPSVKDVLRLALVWTALLCVYASYRYSSLIFAEILVSPMYELFQLTWYFMVFMV